MPAVYATLADLQARFAESELIQLTDDAMTGAIDEGRAGQALSSASAIVEGYIAATYDLDSAKPVPLLLVDLTCDIARYRLYRQSPPEDVVDRNKEATRQLEAIRSGKMKIDDGAEAVPPRDGVVLTQGGDRQFSRTQMTGF